MTWECWCFVFVIDLWCIDNYTMNVCYVYCCKNMHQTDLCIDAVSSSFGFTNVKSNVVMLCIIHWHLSISHLHHTYIIITMFNIQTVCICALNQFSFSCAFCVICVSIGPCVADQTSYLPMICCQAWIRRVLFYMWHAIGVIDFYAY